MEYGENKQTSFTFKKVKKFREWADCSPTNEIKINDDVLEVILLMMQIDLLSFCRSNM